MDILEELSLQMVKQFFITMKYCIELMLSGQSFFEFTCALLEKQVENIWQTRGSDRARAHQVLVEQLGTYSRDLRNLERVSLVADAQRISKNLCIK